MFFCKSNKIFLSWKFKNVGVVHIVFDVEDCGVDSIGDDEDLDGVLQVVRGSGIISSQIHDYVDAFVCQLNQIVKLKFEFKSLK